MSIVPKTDGKAVGRNNRRNRKKKRRTEDFSSDSDSSSSSENESEQETEDKEEETQLDQDGDVVLSDHEDVIEEETFQDTQRKIQTINLTKTDLNNGDKNINLGNINSTLKADRKELEDEYLGLMFDYYGDDIVELRNAPDFNPDRSLNILATVLRNGSNIFDEDTLKTVVSK